MKIRKFFTVTNGVYKASLKTEDWSQADLELMQKFGPPEVDVGGTFTGPPAFTLSSNLANILTDTPFIQSFDDRDFPLGVVDITTVADIAASLDATYFVLQDVDGSVAFWIDVDDSGTTIPAGASAATRAIEITTIVTGDSAINVASKLQVAIAADSKFTAVAANDVVAVINVDAGDLTDAADGDTTFTFDIQADSTDADERADVWATEVEQRICDAVTELRTNQDDFTREEVKTI